MYEEITNVVYGHPYCRQHITDYFKRLGITPLCIRFYNLEELLAARDRTFNVFGELDKVTEHYLRRAVEFNYCKVIRKTID
jgi:hypothetical protein